MPIDQNRLVDDHLSRTRLELDNIIAVVGQNLRHEISIENARLHDRVSTVEMQLGTTKLKLDDANSKVADMAANFEDMENKLQESERRNVEMKRELEQARKRWRGIVLPGYHEMESEREKLRRKLEKKEDELVSYKLKTKVARRYMKKANYVLKDDEVVVYRPGSRSSMSSESSCCFQHPRRRM